MGCNPGWKSLTSNLRWGFEGHVVTDCGALKDLPHYFEGKLDSVETTALALRSGCDLICGYNDQDMKLAFERGLITEKDIDRASTRKA